MLNTGLFFPSLLYVNEPLLMCALLHRYRYYVLLRRYVKPVLASRNDSHLGGETDTQPVYYGLPQRSLLLCN